MKKLVLGTRGSALALVQADLTELALRAAFPQLELSREVVTTSGDRGIVADARAGLKGAFVKEIEEALQAGRVDVAVHSLKDVPGQDVVGLMIAAVLERAPVDDLLIWRGDAERVRARVGTSSVRRAHQLRWLRPELEPVELRGNVPTRLQKLRDGVCEAAMLAEAGIVRLGIDLAREGFFVEKPAMYPAIGQGAVALQCRVEDAETRGRLGAINHGPTWLRIVAERELLRLLDGDCQMPVGVRTELREGVLTMEAVLFVEGEEAPRTGKAMGAEDEGLGVAREVFWQLKI